MRRSILALLSTRNFIRNTIMEQPAAVSKRARRAEQTLLRAASSLLPPVPQPRINGDHLVAALPDEYENLLAVKVQKMRDLIADALPATVNMTPDIFQSPKEHFRMRANFNIWRDIHKDDSAEGMYYAMFDKEQQSTKASKAHRGMPCEIKNYPHGTVKINSLMKGWLQALHEHPVLCAGLFEVRFLTTQTEDAVIVGCYKKPLTAEWQSAADVVANQLHVKIVGRSRKVKMIAGGLGETVEEILMVHGKPIKLYQQEGAFSQPNAKVCEKMLEWSMDATTNSHDSDLLELYCGGGTFTAALASNFRQVLATEMSKASVELAMQAFKANNITNIRIARLSSEEFTEAYVGTRTFQRLEEAEINCRSYQFSTVLVDPPRAGLDPLTCKLLSQFDKIVYISCNPETLARDLKLLGVTHNAVRLAAFDQFPYSHHLESGVILRRKSPEELAIAAAAAAATAIAASSSSASSSSSSSLGSVTAGVIDQIINNGNKHTKIEELEGEENGADASIEGRLETDKSEHISGDGVEDGGGDRAGKRKTNDGLITTTTSASTEKKMKV